MSAIASSGNALRFLDPTDARTRAAWDEFVKASPTGTIFHTTGWMDVIRHGLGFPPRFGYLAGADGSIRALIPLFQTGGFLPRVRWLNLPQSCSSEPLTASQDEAESLLAAVAAVADAQGAQALVLRTSVALKPILPAGWELRRDEPMLRHTLNLVGADDIERLPRCQARLRRTVRQLRKTLPLRGVEVRRLAREEGQKFARVFHEVLLRSHGHLGYPARFFEAMLEFLPEATRLLIVGPANGRAQAFVFCLWSPSCSHCIYCVGLPTEEGKEAARLGMAAEMTAAMQAGLKTFDLGESAPHQEGLIASKERWGAERTDGSYLVLARQGTSSGLNIMGRSFTWATPWLRYIPVSLSLKIAVPIHRYLQ